MKITPSSKKIKKIIKKKFNFEPFFFSNTFL